MPSVKRIFVEKKNGFNVASEKLLKDLREYLGILNLELVRLLIRYDIEGITEEIYQKARRTVFSDPSVDIVYEEGIATESDEYVFAVEYLPGQYDQRADSTMQCIEILSHGQTPVVKTATVFVLKGVLSAEEISTIKKYIINPVDSHEASLIKPETLTDRAVTPSDVAVVEGFIQMTESELSQLRTSLGCAMSQADMCHCQNYFRCSEKRNPTITELRLLDTYWSDHCRHTTFLTTITDVVIEEGAFTKPIRSAFDLYKESRANVYGKNEAKPMCLMDLAVIGMKELRKQGLLDDLDISDEINACSINITAKVNGKEEPWIIMFKNETHNHPTEIEPFGGAATCLGGAIRDPLSGRSYVYQAMRVSGCGDPRISLSDTLPGKLPQRKISVEAARGYSSYGNQIGLATGIVSEIYHEGYVAKRMEVGAVIGAAPKNNVIRATPRAGDVILLVGGKTGRDGCGGATGSSKEHTETSLETCGAEVQKGNPVTERKIQRLFRNPQVSRMIKKCNDFGAGGVAVAIGELADGLDIDCDKIPKKYAGLDGTELVISESQERMAVLIDNKDIATFVAHAAEENLEATVVATVNDSRRVTIRWRGKCIVDLSRDFINTNGILQNTSVTVTAPNRSIDFFRHILPEVKMYQSSLKQAWFANLSNINVCSQRGLIEQFDSTIGAASVLFPFGGTYQHTPTETMIAKLPVLHGETTTGTIMTYGFDPALSQWSPFHGALYAVVAAVSRIVASGGEYQKTRLTLQEYFEKLGSDPKKWGKPFSALLGAFFAQKHLGIAAIGGKDSMSGTFEHLSVPPTLIAFAVCPVNIQDTITPEFKGAGNNIIYVPVIKDDNNIPDFDLLQKQYNQITAGIHNGSILAAATVGTGGIAATVTKMALGNGIGAEFTTSLDNNLLFSAQIGSFVCEVDRRYTLTNIFSDIPFELLGVTIPSPVIKINTVTIPLSQAFDAWESSLESLFPTTLQSTEEKIEKISYTKRATRRAPLLRARPRVFIPVFPGTNCEYDSQRVFQQAGAVVETFVFKNTHPSDIDMSLNEMVKKIDHAQIVMLSGGFSAGDEPDGSGKFIAAIFRNQMVREAVSRFLKQRDGLMLGICNGFQALIKLGLVPFGEIRDSNDQSPTLTYNKIGRHQSRVVHTRIASTLSPWFARVEVGDIHTLAISHGEGRFCADDAIIQSMTDNGQIATQYVDLSGNPTYNVEGNPNGSDYAIEGITSPDGRVLGKMAHSERIGQYVMKNIPGNKNQKIFESGVSYFQ